MISEHLVFVKYPLRTGSGAGVEDDLAVDDGGVAFDVVGDVGGGPVFGADGRFVGAGFVGEDTDGGPLAGVGVPDVVVLDEAGGGLDDGDEPGADEVGQFV